MDIVRKIFPISKRNPEGKRNQQAKEENQTSPQKQAGTINVQNRVAETGASKHNAQKNGTTSPGNSKALPQKHISGNPKNSQHAERKDNGGSSPQSAKPTENRQSTVIKNPAEEQYRKKLLRRQIRKGLEELYAQGEACEASQILAFIQTFSHEMGLVREVLVSFGSQDVYPISMIWQYLSNTSASLEAFHHEIETRQLVRNLTQQRDQLARSLPDPFLSYVPATEQGPRFAGLTAEVIEQLLRDLLGQDMPEFQIKGTFPLLHQGDYPLQLDFSHGILLPLTLRLQAQSVDLPEDCLPDFEGVKWLTIPDSVDDIQLFLQEYLADVSPDDVIDYCTHLSTVLVTAYHYGYGKTPWVQELLQQWRNKQEEYKFRLGESEIKVAIERINREGDWVIHETLDDGVANEEALREQIHQLLARDRILAGYHIEPKWEEHDKQGYLTLQIIWQGKCIGVIDLQRSTTLLLDTKKLEREEDRKLSQVLELLFIKAFQASSPLAQSSPTLQAFQTFVKRLKQEVFEASLPSIDANRLPNNISALLAESRKYDTNQQRAQAFLTLVRSYGEQEQTPLCGLALAQSCLCRSWQYSRENRREARRYMQSFLYLHSQMSLELQQSIVRDLYRCVALYLGTYNLPIDVRDATGADIASRFYTQLLKVLSDLHAGQYDALAHCLVELATINSRFLSDQINRLKVRKHTEQLQIISKALQEGRIFRTETLACLQLLARINPDSIAHALARQSLSTAEERRRIANALLVLATSPNTPPEVLLRGFASHASNDVRIKLAFSLLVEPFVLGEADKESRLKAVLIAEALGLPSGIAATEFFLGKATELSQLFDRFSRSQDPNLKGRFAISILETIRSTRRQLLDSLRASHSDQALRELILSFFRSTESYVTAEQAKLIYDTALELVLVSDRSLHSPQHTRITVEIRNVGEGFADHLMLELFPVAGKYQVEERERIHTIDILADKTPLQKELFIQPLVGVNESIELSLTLRYDTFKKKDKVAELAGSNRTVWLYPESQFLRVLPPYNHSAPATTSFYGRKNLLETMADNLRTGAEHDTSIIVYGLKRAGKTSVVRRFIDHTLHERSLGQTHIPIYADLLQTSPHLLRTDGDFLYFLTEIIVKEMMKQGIALSFVFSAQVQEQFRRNPFPTFSTYLSNILPALSGQHVLLVLDEFSTLYESVAHPTAEKSLSADLFGFLSNTIQSTPQLTFIFTGTYMLLDMMRTHMYDLAKICNPQLISFLDETSARQLIIEPVLPDPENPSKGWLEYDRRVVDRIVSYTHCHPYLIQYICRFLVDRMNELMYHRVNLNDLEVIVDAIINKPMHEMVMRNMWNDFNLTQQKVLSLVASLTNASQRWVEISEIADIFEELGEAISLDEVDSICASLADAELLGKNRLTADQAAAAEQSESYRITIPLYQMWLKYNKPARTVFGNRSIGSPGQQ